MATLADNLSFVPIQISLCFGDAELAIGTAFFYERHRKTYLLTNWHNVTGRRPDTKNPISPTCGIPDEIMCRLPFRFEDSEKRSGIQWVQQRFSLYEDEARDIPRWMEHPVHGEAVGVVAIEFNGLEKLASICATDPKLDLEPLQMRPGMDIFVLGFPRGMFGGARFPIWKRAS